ncbi:hypothetical protein MD588_06810 [Photobacterium sp. SDRW27]|uniref:hypothetical protein n=1 Tax=Photobacterium obscurum TaxID=2829490 RepID=UPI0022449F43|nr:hypothetical protein [Photobacterium obscurum]MCW8328514.1 hypothetical protein [Photobacterium obscurum]
MLKSLPLISILVTASGIAYSQPAYNVLPDNEILCKQAMGKLLAQQQVIFSDNQAAPDVRRAAERAIDTSREAFRAHGSYCEAQEALQAYKPEKDKSFRYRKGEVNFFGRGTG